MSSEPETISNSESFVNQVTLQYLMNKSQYSNYLEKKTSDTFSKRERKYYSQRFIKLTKKLLLKRKSVEDMPSDIKFAFENYVKSCIHHFKMTDQTDSIQAEYYKDELEEEGEEGDQGEVEVEEEVEGEVEGEGEGEVEVEEEECLGEDQEDQEDQMRSLKSKMEYMYLDNFVKTTPINNTFIPQQKNIELIEDDNNKNKKVKRVKNNINKL
jgi:hypothetical protein